MQEEVDALTRKLERREVELAAKTALEKRRNAPTRIDDENEPPNNTSDPGGIDPATSGVSTVEVSDFATQHDCPPEIVDPIVRLSVSVDPIAALDLVGRDELECVEAALATCKKMLAQREEELVQLCVAKEASDEKCDALMLELDSEAQNSLCAQKRWRPSTKRSAPSSNAGGRRTRATGFDEKSGGDTRWRRR